MSLEDEPASKRDEMYRLIIGQLFYDGHPEMAVELSNLLKEHGPCPPTNRLIYVVRKGLHALGEWVDEQENDAVHTDAANLGNGIDLNYQIEGEPFVDEQENDAVHTDAANLGSGIDLDYQTEGEPFVDEWENDAVHADAANLGSGIDLDYEAEDGKENDTMHTDAANLGCGIVLDRETEGKEASKEI